MTTLEIVNFEKRLETLERQNRWLKSTGIIMLLVIGSVLLIGATTPTRTVKAEKFLLTDEKGKPRATLGVDKDGTGLRMLNANGEPGAALVIDQDGARISFVDVKGTSRATVGVDSDGPSLTLYDANGKVRALLSLLADLPNLVLCDQNEKPRALLGVGANGTSGFRLSDASGKAVYTAP